MPSEFGLLGTGVTVAGFVTYYDRFLENAIANRNTSLEQQSTEATYFSRVETILNEDNSNLAANITNFFNGWSELSADPTSYAARSSLAIKGENLARTFNNLYNELNALQKELDNSVESEVAEINRLTAGNSRFEREDHCLRFHKRRRCRLCQSAGPASERAVGKDQCHVIRRSGSEDLQS